jgi:hypothetical protein
MAHLPNRWLGIITGIVRGYIPDPELLAYSSLLDEGADLDYPGRSHPERIEIVLLEPSNLDPDTLRAIRRSLVASDLPVEADIRALSELTLQEQELALERGVRFGK